MHPVLKWFLTSRAVEAWILRMARAWLAIVGASGLGCAFVLIGRGAYDVFQGVARPKLLCGILGGLAFAAIVLAVSFYALVIVRMDMERQAEDEEA